MAIDLLPLPVSPDLPPVPEDTAKQKEWLEDLRKRYNTMYGILRQDVNRLNAPVRAPVVDDSPDIGYAVARSTLNDTALVLGMNRVQVGLNLANGADRGKITIAFTYLGVGPLVLGSGASTSYTVDLAVAGVNGLDTGAEANSTWYYVFVISGDHGPDVTDNTANNEQPPLRRHATPTATLLSVSAAPKLPAGYNRYRRVGMVYNNSAGNLYRFTNAADDDWFWWNEDVSAAPFLVLNETTSAVAFTDVACAGAVPVTSRTILFVGATTDGGAHMQVRNNDHANVAYSTYLTQVSNMVASGNNAVWFECGCDSGQIVEYRAANTTDDCRLSVVGYRDIR